MRADTSLCQRPPASALAPVSETTTGSRKSEVQASISGGGLDFPGIPGHLIWDENASGRSTWPKSGSDVRWVPEYAAVAVCDGPGAAGCASLPASIAWTAELQRQPDEPATEVMKN